MFKPHIGICICHGVNNLIVVKLGYCRLGNENHKKLKNKERDERKPKKQSTTSPGFIRKKPIQKLSQKFRFKKMSSSQTGKTIEENSYENRKKKLQVLNRFKRVKKNKTGEKALFLEIWDERPHVCSCCNAPLGEEPKPVFFSHLLSKGAYPAFRLLKRNIWLKCEECHVLWETASRNTDRFKLANIEFQSLKQLYYARKNV